jgi:hypothetical protein
LSGIGNSRHRVYVMELCAESIQQAVHPTAAFVSLAQGNDAWWEATTGPSWANSLLNPKNRIDSLDLPMTQLWRIDGCTGLGTQYYAVPLFISPLPPMRMDVFIPEDQPLQIRRQLQLDVAFHTKDSVRLPRLAVARHIIRTLQFWVATEFQDLDAFEAFYRSAPFGTRLVFENMSLDVRQISVRVGLNHNLERQLLSVSDLTKLWGSDFVFPQVIDFDEVQVVRVIHDSVCIVDIAGERCIFKALTSGSKYLYHELKTLCTLKPHSNVIDRPIHMVRKLCRFGGKKAILGFTTFLHSNGSLRDILPNMRLHKQLKASDQIKWALQLTIALEHLRSTSRTYYPDLRLDNIVLSKSLDIIMVDFEQRGVWCEFAAPEINCLEYVRLLATDESVDDHVRERYAEILKRAVPEYELLEGEKYTNPEDGYNACWIAQSALEQEAAEVYMLGRVLWCIYEGVSGPQTAAVWQSYQWESDLEFPQYRNTPLPMRLLIDDCTKGYRGTLNDAITRRKSKLIIRDKELYEQGPREVKDAAGSFWESEMQVAEDFLSLKEETKRKGAWNENYYGRPTLKEVMERLRYYETRLVKEQSL